MAQGYAIGYPKFRALDANGNPISGALVHTYASGTSTPKLTYSDAALTSANANPVVCDASGECWIFVDDGELYTISLHDAADALMWTKDGIEATTSPAPTPAAPNPVPTGTILWSPYSTTPTGYLKCDGSAVSRTTYSALAALAAVDSYPNGSGDGSTTFNVPDLRGRAPYGLAASGTGSTLGGTFGAIDHTHTGPSHTHTTAVPHTGWGGTQIAGPGASGTMLASDGAAQNPTQSTADQTITSSASGTGDTGTANPPGLAGNWFIKT